MDRRSLIRIGVVVAMVGTAALLIWIRPGGDRAHHVEPVLLSGAPRDAADRSFRVGDRVGLGRYALTVHSVTDPFVPLTQYDSSGVRPGDRMIAVEVTVENETDSPLVQGFSTLTLEGPRDAPSLSLLVYPKSRPRLADEVPAHGRMRGNVFFGLPPLAARGALVFLPEVSLLAGDAMFGSEIHVQLG